MSGEDDGSGGKPALSEEDLATHIPLIRNYLRKLVRTDELEDAVQTVLARALEGLHRYRGESAPRVWLLGIARNVGFEAGRSRQRRPTPMEETPNFSSAVEEEQASQEVKLSDQQHQALLLQALAGLGLDERLVLLMTYVDEVEGREAADILDLSFAAFRKRLSRARKALAAELERMMREGTRADAAALARWQKVVLDPQRGGGEQTS